jgi:CubicO group peptidase (beta-lactamase class C family)
VRLQLERLYMTAVTSMLTAAQVGERLGVDPEAVRSWCASKQLVAINVARNPRGKRPRWRVSEAALDEFLARRTSGKSPEAAPQRRRAKAANIIQFF